MPRRAASSTPTTTSWCSRTSAAPATSRRSTRTARCRRRRWPACSTGSTRLATVTVPAGRRDIFANRAMRALNHEHMFSLPAARRATASISTRITPGLADAARELAADRAYATRSPRSGGGIWPTATRWSTATIFREAGCKAGDGVRVIDPEFCFLGDAGVRLRDPGRAPDAGALCAPPRSSTVTARGRARGASICALVAAYAGRRDHAPPDRRRPAAADRAASSAKRALASAFAPARGRAGRRTRMMRTDGAVAALALAMALGASTRRRRRRRSGSTPIRRSASRSATSTMGWRWCRRFIRRSWTSAASRWCSATRRSIAGCRSPGVWSPTTVRRG